MEDGAPRYAFSIPAESNLGSSFCLLSWLNFLDFNFLARWFSFWLQLRFNDTFVISQLFSLILEIRGYWGMLVN